MKYKTKKKLFNVINNIITHIEQDKLARLFLSFIFIWMILILIGLWQTKANYIQNPTKKQTVVWWYTWWSKAIELNNKLIKIWYSPYKSALIINKCKKFRKTWVVDCIIALASIWKAESNMFRKCYNNNCVGMYDWRKWYKNISDWLDDFMIRYNKYWYTWRQKWGTHFFYPYNWKMPLSRYCLARTNYWYLNFKKTFNYLIK